MKSIFIFLAFYVIANIIIFAITGIEPSTLTTCVFAFCGVEGGALAWIKTTETKKKKGEKDEPT
jgi:hypothetical protein